MDGAGWGGEGEEVLIGGRAEGGSEMAGVAVKGDDGYGVGVSEEELQVMFRGCA